MASEIWVQRRLVKYGLAASDTQTLKFLTSGRGLLREDGVTGPDSWSAWFQNAVVCPDQVLLISNRLSIPPPLPSRSFFLLLPALSQCSSHQATSFAMWGSEMRPRC